MSIPDREVKVNDKRSGYAVTCMYRTKDFPKSTYKIDTKNALTITEALAMVKAFLEMEIK